MGVEGRQGDRVFASLAPARKPFVLNMACLVVFLLVLLRTAWMCDDAYIGLRTVDNFVNGYGLTWNTAERVQAYTCPLWILVLSAFYAVTREAFFTSLFLSIGISLLVLSLVVRAARTAYTGLLVATILVLSRAFVDFSTSGLENPLTHLCIAGFLTVYLHGNITLRSLGVLSAIAGLGILNRMDTALLFLVPLSAAFLQAPRWRSVCVLAAGLLPFLIWEAFSLFYYGFLFPNTAYAKLGTSYETSALLKQGGYYFLNSLQVDPITCVTIVTGLFTAWIGKDRRSPIVSAGIVLYLCYIVTVGGDFMSGRFLSAPLLASAILISRADFAVTTTRQQLIYAAFVVLGLLAPHPIILSGADYRTDAPLFLDEQAHGIGDERSTYFPYASLSSAWRVGRVPSHRWVDQGLEAKKLGLDIVVKGNIGFFGYYAGPHVYIVDPGALTDPLLARLPAVHLHDWRIGHFTRKIPDGYIAYHNDRSRSMGDKNLTAFHDALAKATRGPLFDTDRLREIWNLNTGRYRALIDSASYQSPPCEIRHLSEVGANRSPDRELYISPTGIEIQLGKGIAFSRLELSLSSDEWYELFYLNSEETIARQTIIPRRPLPPMGQLAVYSLSPPEEVSRKPCDRLRIVPIPRLNDGSCRLGFLRLMQ